MAAFKDRDRYRSAVESTMSAFDRLTGVKHLRMRVLAAVQFAVPLKALSINLYRVETAWKAKDGGGNPNPSGIGPFQNVLMSLCVLHATFLAMVQFRIIKSAPRWRRCP